jgi:PAS domain S-box-containing protein
MDNLTQLAFDSAPIGVVLTENRIIRTCNTMFCKMTGFRMGDLVDQSCRILYSSEAEFDRVRDIGIQALSKGEPYSDLRLLLCSNGEVVWCRFRANALDRNDPLARTVLTFARLQETAQFPTLTKRERDVVLGLRSGRTSKHIAAELGLSTRTIEDVRARLLKKFQAATTHEVVAKFISLES